MHLSLLDFIIMITSGEVFKLWSSSLCSFFQPPVTYHFWGFNVLPTTSFSDILSLCSLNMRDKVSRTYEYNTIRKIILLYILIFTFLARYCKSRIFQLCRILKRSISYFYILFLLHFCKFYVTWSPVPVSGIHNGSLFKWISSVSNSYRVYCTVKLYV
jgi:hypothetical protein